MLDGTGKTLDALENMFGLDIDSSDSGIEIAPAANSEYLKHLGDGTLYTVSSALAGELTGSVLLIMRSMDFKRLGEVMKPILSLLYLSSPDADLATLDNQKQDWMHDSDDENKDESEFHEHMLDLLAELGNVLIGLYSKSIYNICKVNSDHSIPYALRDTNQQLVQRVLASADEPDQPYLVIENEFVVMGKSIKLWCLISPTKDSFEGLLDRIENRSALT
jgi:chemotaxis protein CheY-P-specific phosphatase CheC